MLFDEMPVKIDEQDGQRGMPKFILDAPRLKITFRNKSSKCL